jgi:hypothetical protein
MHRVALGHALMYAESRTEALGDQTAGIGWSSTERPAWVGGTRRDMARNFGWGHDAF